MIIEEFEHEIMTIMLAGDDPMLAALRDQYKASVVKCRKFTGVGCFIDFDISAGTPLVSPSNFEISDVCLGIQEVEHGAMAVLLVRNGMIDFLEMATYIGQWPDDLILESVSYLYNAEVRSPTTTSERDLDALRKSWKPNIQVKS